MNNLFICSTRYLKLIENNFDLEIDFFRFSNIEDKLISIFNNDLCISKIGINNFPPLENAPYFFNYIDENLSDKERIRNSEKDLEYFQMIIANLWFIKDCSCNTREYFDISFISKEILARSRTIFFCSAKGEYFEEIFSLNDFIKSVEITNKIIDLQQIEIEQQNIYEKPNQGTGHITPSDQNYFLYANTNRIHRSITFLTIARSNSFLPLKISFYIGVLETLFTTDNNEVTHKVSERVSFYLQEKYNKLETFKLVKECYGIRSSFVHGQKLHKKYNYEKLAELSFEFDQIIRFLLNKIILDDYNIFLKNDENLTIFFNSLIFK